MFKRQRRYQSLIGGRREGSRKEKEKKRREREVRAVRRVELAGSGVFGELESSPALETSLI